MLALALDQRSAADELGLGPGDQVTLAQLTDDGDRGAAAGMTSPVTLRAR